MSVESHNATPPGPAIAPGAELIEPRRVAEELAARAGGAMDSRVRALVPDFDAPFFQAGLAGYSDAPMRLIARRHGCPFCVTEALLDRTLLAGGRGFVKADLGEIHDNVPGGELDHPLAGQIMGSCPQEMAAAAIKMLEQGRRADKEYRKMAYAVDGVFPSTATSAREHLRLPGGEQLPPFDPTEGLEDSCQVDLAIPEQADGEGRVGAVSKSFEVIDVNLACPVKKIDRKARGGHWLTEPHGAIEILEAVRDALPAHVVCAVKMRRSYDDTPEMVENFHTIFEACYKIGYAWTTVHARTVEQKYVGPSRWTFLKDLTQRYPQAVVFGSGDIWNADDIFRMIAYTGVHAVSVARGCIGNPWIFRQARDMMAGRPPRKPTIVEQREVLLSHFELALAAGGLFSHREQSTAMTMRKFGIRFAEHHPRKDDVRKRFIAVSSLMMWKAVLDEWYQES